MRIETTRVKPPQQFYVDRFKVQNVLVRQHEFPVAVHDGDFHADAYSDRVYDGWEDARKLIPRNTDGYPSRGLEAWLKAAEKPPQKAGALRAWLAQASDPRRNPPLSDSIVA